MTRPLPSGLSMLWEQVDPLAALTDRFGFDGFESAAAWVSDVLAETWGIHVADCSRIVISDQNAIVWVRSDLGDLIVKWSRDAERFGSLDASTRLLRALAERGIPVAAPHPSIDGRDRVIADGPAGRLSVTVLPQLVGDWLDVHDLAAVHAAGVSLAMLHVALGTISTADHEAPTRDIRERVTGWLASGDRGLAPNASHRLGGLVASLPDLDDEQQLVHGDFRAANILTRGSQIVGVLDFDEVRVDHRVLDLAQASVYLGTLFTDWRPTGRDARQALRAGYESVRQLGVAESQWLEALVVWHGIMAIPSADDELGWAAAV